MMIDIRGVPIDRSLRARVARQMTSALAPRLVKPVQARVTFFDENGPKGGAAIRCALTVGVPYRRKIRVEQTSETARLAFDVSLETLRRQLARYRERARESYRRPKKYYIAARLLMAGVEQAAEGTTPPRRQSARPGGSLRANRQIGAGN